MDTNTEVRWEFERAEIVARAIEIARECLDGDPFRNVPKLELQAAYLFELYDGGEHDIALKDAEQSVRRRSEPLPAYAVAASALETAKMAGRAYA